MKDDVLIQTLDNLQKRLKDGNIISEHLRIIIGAYHGGLLFELLKVYDLFVKEQTEISKKFYSENITKH